MDGFNKEFPFQMCMDTAHLPHFILCIYFNCFPSSLFLSVAQCLVTVTMVLMGVGVVMTQDAGRPVVEVQQGRVVGVVKEHNNFSYNAFLGVPYAKPPLNERRFKVKLH